MHSDAAIKGKVIVHAKAQRNRSSLYELMVESVFDST